MGPASKDAICNVLGFILDEQQQQRSTVLHELGAIRNLLQQRLETENRDMAQLNHRVTQLERILRSDGGSPVPAE